ncbi:MULTISPECIES: type II toxin-antitoxin system PemK/MazF family toxin [Bacillus]|uniref:type II toxin-antitoxin system PemK/MazF family toxin n=1 Tax=Bacillus TaxID=1386 RepID=UPI000F862E76|nr:MULTISPECIES: type II toxin-antitoxin system PemK/MazF family toxin [Bacillus]MEE3607367.1 type II toxin-antitoxin system PemK/MazF family toxin [Bacillus altitudinis]MCY7707976.1 type II toxin-antitoxin system PemK/MazF family toxin [Bacillus safensis]MCY7728022.1 type II toxin-antitoxin system PemK/MazF family toxin [Bacillus safensis]MEE3613480.1 type II toxin-antitoxin system PemK/MazF family toxin [Bacillus altitudinis]MEE3649094.1 type II toxin-antitoxin system PemK/MazF family toxin 
MDRTKLELGNIYLAITEFRDGTGRKARPVLILGSRLEENQKVLIGYITSKNDNKEFEKYKYPIIDWKAAGLNKQSWVVLQERELQWMDANLDLHKHVGLLTERDILGVLKKFVYLRDQENKQQQSRDNLQIEKKNINVVNSKSKNKGRSR